MVVKEKKTGKAVEAKDKEWLSMVKKRMVVEEKKLEWLLKRKKAIGC